MYRYIDSSCTQHYCMYCTTSKLLLHVQVYIEFIYSPEVRIIYYLNTSPTLSSFTVPPQNFSYMYRYNQSSCTSLSYIYCTTSTHLLHVQVQLEFMQTPLLHVLYFSYMYMYRYRGHVVPSASCTVLYQHFSYMYRYKQSSYVHFCYMYCTVLFSPIQNYIIQ